MSFSTELKRRHFEKRWSPLTSIVWTPKTWPFLKKNRLLCSTEERKLVLNNIRMNNWWHHFYFLVIYGIFACYSFTKLLIRTRGFSIRKECETFQAKPLYLRGDQRLSHCEKSSSSIHHSLFVWYAGGWWCWKACSPEAVGVGVHAGLHLGQQHAHRSLTLCPFFILLFLCSISWERQEQRNQAGAGGNSPQQLQQSTIQGDVTCHVQNCGRERDITYRDGTFIKDKVDYIS